MAFTTLVNPRVPGNQTVISTSLQAQPDTRMPATESIMAATIRILFVLAIAFGLHQIPSVQAFEQTVLELPAVADSIQAARDSVDKRPRVAVLFIGNSRTFYNNMPAMVRRIADSADSKYNYHVAMYATGGASLKNHWEDPKVQELLKQKWDYVVLQGGSSEQINPTMQSSFYTYGSALVTLIKTNGARPVLFVAWRCLPDYYPQLYDVSPQAFYYQIQNSYYQVARATGAASVNVGKTWEKLLAASAAPLYVDGNHPNIRGSYLTALMFYRFLSNDDPRKVTYVPYGITPEDATMLKTAAQEG
jgi:hypothetical protein